MSDVQRYAIIPLGDGPPPPDALVIGTLSDVTTYIPQSVERKELEQILEEVSQARDHAEQIAAYEQTFKDKVAAFNAACDKRLAALDDRQHRLDAKRAKRAKREEQRRITTYLDGLPDDTDDLGVHRPTGDLHTLAPPDKGHWDPEADDAEGDLPPDIERKTPSALGNYSVHDPKDLQYPPPRNAKQVPQPIAVSLNEE